MTDFVIHGIPGSPYVRAPLIALEEKGASWRLEVIGFGANREEAYRSIHPFNKIPTLDHGDFRLYETRAILAYIDRVVDGLRLMPETPRAIARMDQIIGIVDAYLAQRVSGPLTFPRVVAPRFGMPVDEAAVAAAVEPAAYAVGEVTRLLGSQRYMTGDAISLADIMLIPHLAFLPAFEEGRAILARYDAIAGWIDRMVERPSLKATTWEALTSRAGG